MSFTTYQKGTYHPNWLESEVGLVLKTYQIAQNKGVDDGYGHKIVKSGTPYPEAGSNAVGLVFEDVDVTSGDMPGSVMVAGRVLNSKLNISSSEATLKTKGFTFVETEYDPYTNTVKEVDRIPYSTGLRSKVNCYGANSAIQRGYKVTYVKGQADSGTPPTDSNSYFDGDIVTVSADKSMVKASNTCEGWALEDSKTSKDDAVTSFAIHKDTTLYPVFVASE